jgi:hypothetical protein
VKVVVVLSLQVQHQTIPRVSRHWLSALSSANPGLDIAGSRIHITPSRPAIQDLSAPLERIKLRAVERLLEGDRRLRESD